MEEVKKWLAGGDEMELEMMERDMEVCLKMMRPNTIEEEKKWLRGGGKRE